MADVRQQVNALIGLLERFAGESKEAETALAEFAPILERMVSGKVISDWGSLADAINQVAGALANLGVSSTGIEKIRTSLQQAGAEYRYFSGQFAPKKYGTSEVPQTGVLKNLAGIRAQREALVRSRTASQITTPEQMQNIRAQQESQYQALRSQAQNIAPRRQLFDQGADAAEREAATIRSLSTAVQELTAQQAGLQAAYERTYSARLKAGQAKIDAQGRRDELARKGAEAGGKAPVPLGQALRQYEGFIPGGETGIKNLQTRLEALGVTQVNSVNATREISNGVTTMSVRMTEASGAVVRGSVHMDKFGGVLKDTSRRFRSFTDAVGTNIIKVTQWAVATGLVYGIVRQVSQVFKEIIEVQAKLAEVQIALGKSQGDLNRVFEEAISIANLTSSSVAGVVEAYAIAYRATGQYSDEVQRVAVTNKLLQESMILAKLAGIDQATSIDTLVGALRQTGLELDQGRTLLDKWVFVSRQANVSLDTLAQTYSIVGTTAKGVGIEMEELNALAATLAEATGLSATETGNALRGIISGFQSATSEQTLARFGIATRDATGKLRDFMGLYEELAVLTQSGVLSDRDITEIANAIGGGYRRGAQVETLLKNNQSVARLTAEQAGASGAAAEALEIKMSTLESAITRLGNAFTQFAQTLGSGGGFLELITGIVDAMSGFLELITDLTSGLGKATPAILAFSAAWAVLGSARGQDLLKGIINMPVGGIAARGLGAVGIGPSLAEQQMIAARQGGPFMGPGYGAGRGVTVGGAFQQARAGIGGKIGFDPLGLIAPALIAGSAVKKGIQAGEGKERDLEFGRAATSVVGAIVGGIITAGNPLGIAAGSAMASSFYKGVVQYEDDLASYWAGVVRKGQEEAAEEEEEGGPPVGEQIGFAPRALAGIQAALGTVGQWAGATGQGGLLGTGIGSRRGQEDMDPRAFITGQAQALITYLETGEITSGFYGAVYGLDEETARAILEEQRSAVEGETIEIGVELDIAEGIKELKPVVGPIVDEFIAEQQRKMVLGQLDLGEFTQLPQTLDTTKIATQLQKVVMAADFAGMSLDVEEYTAYMIQLDNTTRQYLTTLADDVVAAHTAWTVSLAEGKDTLEETAALEAEYFEKRDRYATISPAVRQQFELEQVPRRQIFEVGRLTQDQVNLAAKAAQAYRLKYNMEMTEGNEELARDMALQLEPFLIQYGEGLGATFGQTIGNATAADMTQAIKDYGWEDALSDVDFGFQDLRDSLSMGDIPDLMSRYQKVVGTFQTFFPDYDVEEENVGLITKDGLTTVHADLTLLNLAMQDLIDVSEQQLEGVWNIPQGMTAMVAWSSLFTRDVGGGGQIPTEGDVFTEERQGDIPETDTLANLEAQLAALNAQIADYSKVVAMGPEELGMQEYLATQYDLREAEKEKASVLEQIALTQLGAGLGIEAMGDVSIADQLREALSIQNKIELNASIRLVVDGRTLANIVKQYLFEDLVTASDKVTGTGSGDYVVGH